MEIRSHVIEEFGMKSYKLGFFQEWQTLKTIIQERDDIPGFEAAEKAYLQLKNK